MFRSLLLSSLALIALGCSHNPPSPSVVTVPSDVPVAKETVLTPGDRNPSGEPRIYWRSATKSYDVGSAGLSTTDEFSVQQIMEWETQVRVPRTRWVDGWVVETDSICEGYQCSGGAGQSPAWNAYFSASRDRKPARLADAIKGIGETSARKLIAAGYFHSKPRSWRAFVDEIDRAARSNVITKGVRYQAAVQYRYDNMTNLGYSSTSCQTYTYRCEKVYWGLVQENYIATETQTQSRVMEQRNRRINFSVREPKLQAFEKESISLIVGEGDQDIQVQSAGYTKYGAPSISGGQNATVEVVGQERIPVDLPYSAYQGNEYKIMGGKPVLSIKVDPKFLGGASQGDQLVVTYYVQTCKLSWIGCGFNPWVNSEVKTVPLTAAVTNIEIESPAKHKTQVKFRISRKNSIWYNDKPLNEVETDEVKM